jgi:hypothetical protein
VLLLLCLLPVLRISLLATPCVLMSLLLLARLLQLLQQLCGQKVGCGCCCCVLVPVPLVLLLLLLLGWFSLPASASCQSPRVVQLRVLSCQTVWLRMP